MFFSSRKKKQQAKLQIFKPNNANKITKMQGQCYPSEKL